MTGVEIVLAVAVLLALGLHFLPRKASDPVALQKVEKVDDDVWTWIVDHLKGHAAPGTAAVAPVAPSVTHTVTQTFGGAAPGGMMSGGIAPAGTITTPADSGTFNEVAVPAGMTLATFTALGIAKQGIASFLASASVVASLVTESDGYFASLGAYFVEQLAVQAPAGSPLAARVAQYIAAHPVEVVTDAQEAAALAAVNAVAPPKA